jgi:hypothetical protein
MNDVNNPLPPMNRDAIHRELLDVLVDGELSESERRELLLKLDQSPGGWRACALAFLESQSWKQACGAIAREQDAAGKPIASVVPSGSPAPTARVARSRFRRLFHGGLTVLSMAATFLIALSLGLTLRSWWGDAGRAPGTGGARGVPFPADSQREITVRATPRPWGTARVSFPGAAGQPEQSIAVPVTESEGMDESWFRPGPDMVPADLQATLERLGYQVRQQRELLPFSMEDGSRLVLPIDQVEFRKVAKPAY